MFTGTTNNLKDVLQRAISSRTGQVMFPNSDRSLRIFLRVTQDYDPPEVHDVIELGIKSSCHTQTLTDANPSLVNFGFPGGYYDDDFDAFIVSESRNLLHDDQGLDDLLQEIKILWEATVCPCGERLITDGHDACLVCHMMMTGDGKTDTEMCCICREMSCVSNMDTSTCCSKYVHKACRDVWVNQNRDSGLMPSCPMCREKIE